MIKKLALVLVSIALTLAVPLKSQAETVLERVAPTGTFLLTPDS